MHKVDIETSQNITLSFPAASVVERIGAYIIDIIVQILFFYIITAIFDGIIGDDFLNDDKNAKYKAIIYVFYIPILCYHLLFEYFNNGQSIGKKLLKLRVVNIDGTRPGFSGYVTRWILGLIEFYMFSGAPAMLSIMFGSKGQRIGDLAGGTAVIKVKQPRLLQSPTDKFNFTLDYEPIYPKATLLNDKQVALINNVLNQDNFTLRNKQVGKLTDKIQNEYNIKWDSKSPKFEFLSQIVKDYAFMNWLEENKGQINELKYSEKQSFFGSTLS